MTSLSVIRSDALCEAWIEWKRVESRGSWSSGTESSPSSAFAGDGSPAGGGRRSGQRAVSVMKRRRIDLEIISRPAAATRVFGQRRLSLK